MYGSEPRIVFFDIETVPDLQQALENWTDLVSFRPGKRPTMTASVNSVCSFGYRIFGEKKSVGINAWDFPNWAKNVNDDKAILTAAYDILKDADAIVTFNGKRFDEKFIQTRLAIHGLDLMRKTKHIDLCTIAASNLFLLNNRLKTVAKYLSDDQKLEHDGWPLWVKVHGGVNRKRCKESEEKMGKYNLKDVDLMVPIFKILRPLITNIPNYNLYEVGLTKICPKCGSTRLQPRGHYYTKVSRYRRYRCTDCKSWSRTNVDDRHPRA